MREAAHFIAGDLWGTEPKSDLEIGDWIFHKLSHDNYIWPQPFNLSLLSHYSCPDGFKVSWRHKAKEMLLTVCFHPRTPRYTPGLNDVCVCRGERDTWWWCPTGLNDVCVPWREGQTVMVHSRSKWSVCAVERDRWWWCVCDLVLQVCVDSALNLPWTAFPMGICTLCPPAAVYQGPPWLAYDHPNFIQRLALNSSHSAPQWSDGFMVLKIQVVSLFHFKLPILRHSRNKYLTRLITWSYTIHLIWYQG